MKKKSLNAKKIILKKLLKKLKNPKIKNIYNIFNNNLTIKDILEESLEHELHALSLYKKLLGMVEGASIYLEEYTRNLIGQEEQHQLELRKMLKDFS